MEKDLPVEVYKAEKEALEIKLMGLTRSQSRWGWLRLAIILMTTVMAFQFFTFSLWAGGLVILLGACIFLWVVSMDANNTKTLKNVKRLVAINDDELAVLSGNYEDRYDGHDLQPAAHNYANDLDIFGKFSLYQYVQRCHSEQGQQRLAQNFLQPLGVNEIYQRQEAIKELAPQLKWRQQLQALSMETQVKFSSQQKTQAWLLQTEVHFTSTLWAWFVPLYSFFTIGTALLTLAGYIPGALFTGLFLLYLIFSSALSKNAMKAYTFLSGLVDEMETLHQLMKWIEEKNFEAFKLQQLQASVQVDHTKASQQLVVLKAILNRFDLRLNVFVFIFLNSFLLWDVRQMRMLNHWRQQNKTKVALWYDLVAEFEVLNSLAALHFNEPAWTFPEITEEHFTLDGSHVGHPMLPAAQRVTSRFSLKGQGKVALVTGSNMAGKSTFLRSLGVNIVLAQMGAPVCATSFVFSPVHLMSSMRVTDNLAENTSTFYAELKKLKTIIEAVNRHERVFILLDEILRGTNSLDRHTGTEALIQQLIKEKALAVIATHDVALAAMEKDYPAALENYHFDVQVEGEELYFDYKLKHGVCTSLNASILMKKIGLEING